MTLLFISYSHRDEELRQQLDVHLTALKRQGVIDLWHDRRITPGDQIDTAIDAKLDEANVVLLLVSPDFIASDYCYDVEMRRAMERHDAGEARVIPVILRHCDWHETPFGRLKALPKDGRPITKWPDRDEAFQDVVVGIKAAIGHRPAAKGGIPSAPAAAPSAQQAPGPRSSNLRTHKHFTEADEDQFLEQSFEYIALFFENSLEELKKRNPGLTTSFKRVSSEEFSAVVYRSGKAEARCRIRFGGRRGVMGGISYSSNDSPPAAPARRTPGGDDVRRPHIAPLGRLRLAGRGGCAGGRAWGGSTRSRRRRGGSLGPSSVEPNAPSADP